MESIDNLGLSITDTFPIDKASSTITDSPIDNSPINKSLDNNSAVNESPDDNSPVNESSPDDNSAVNESPDDNLLMDDNLSTDDDSSTEEDSPVDESIMYAELTSDQKAVFDHIKDEIKCDGYGMVFSKSFFESIKSMSQKKLQDILNPQPGAFLEKIEKKKEYTIINKTIELEYIMGENRGTTRMTVVANRMNYGDLAGYIGYYIKCDVPYDCEKGLSCHPFRYIKDKDETGEYISDNDVTRAILHNLVDEESLNSKWNYNDKTETVARLIAILGHLWD